MVIGKFINNVNVMSIMENNNNGSNKKVLYYSVGAIVVVFVLVFWLLSSGGNKAPVSNVDQTSTDETALQPESTLDTSGSTSTTGSPQISISYADALVKYANKRIQFDKTCQAFPDTVTYKDNTGIMLDNRSPVVRTIKVGTTYNVKPYGFKIVVLPDTYLQSKTILVDCDQSQNVATILVQE